MFAVICYSIIKKHHIDSMNKKQRVQNSQGYSKIALETRKRLVLLVIWEGLSIGKAAKRLNLRPSTAKMIVKRYKQSGDFFQSRKQREQRQKEEKQMNSRTNHNAFNSPNCGSPLQLTEEIQAMPSPISQPILYLPQAFNEFQYWPTVYSEIPNISQGFPVMGLNAFFGLHLSE